MPIVHPFVAISLGIPRIFSVFFPCVQVDVSDFLAILDTAKPKVGEVFVDLGSGTGKAVLAAACGFPEFSKVRVFL